MKKIFSFFHEEINYFIYFLVLLLTVSSAHYIMSFYFQIKENYELSINNRKQPIEAIEGLIIVISNEQSLPTIFSNLKEWIIDIQREMNEIEFVFITSNNLSNSLNNSINIDKYINNIVVDNCTDFIVDGNCKFAKSLKQLIPKYPNLKWILRIEPNIFINIKGLKHFIQSLNNDFDKKPLIKAGIRKGENSLILDHRSAWFLSMKTATDWSYITMSYDSNELDETPKELLEILNIDINSVPDEHFISHSFSLEEFNSATNSLLSKCPNSYNYYGFLPKYTIHLEDVVSMNFEGQYQYRIQLINHFKSLMNKQIGILIDENSAFLCLLNNK